MMLDNTKLIYSFKKKEVVLIVWLIVSCSGNPIYLEPYWMQHAASTAIVLSGWHRMGYEYEDGSLISKELHSEIFKLHDIVKNVNTTGRYLIFGAGSTQLLGAAVHSLSLESSQPAKVVASVPYYPVSKNRKPHPCPCFILKKCYWHHIYSTIM